MITEKQFFNKLSNRFDLSDYSSSYRFFEYLRYLKILNYSSDPEEYLAFNVKEPFTINAYGVIIYYSINSDIEVSKIKDLMGEIY